MVACRVLWNVKAETPLRQIHTDLFLNVQYLKPAYLIIPFESFLLLLISLQGLKHRRSYLLAHAGLRSTLKLEEITLSKSQYQPSMWWR